MPRSLLVLGCVFYFFTAAVADEANPGLSKAKQSYYDSIDKARDGLIERFDAAIKTARAAGDLDALKSLQAEKESFEQSGKLPTSARMKKAVLAYHAAIKQATATLEKAFEQAIKEFTKAGKVEQADAVRAELKAFRSKAPATHLKPTDVATKEDLRAYLAETVWTWDEGLKFKADGDTEQKLWQSNGLVARWEAVDRRTVVLLIEKGRDHNLTAVLLFSEDLPEFGGFDFSGKRILDKKKRKP